MTNNDPFGRSRLPTGLRREDRVRMLREFADAVLAGRPPPPEAMMFTASAIDAYLQRGGSLERDHLKVVGPRGSHRTPRAIVHRDEGGDSAFERSSHERNSGHDSR